jgi:para-aminobenzoate synthetase/4-amino-4-deoxychorismate lyase
MFHPLDPVAVLSLSRSTPFLFFDSASHGRCSYVFAHPRAVLRARTTDEVVPLLAEIDRWRLKKGIWIAGFLAYEAAYALEPALAPLTEAAPYRGDYGWFGIFDECLIFDHRTGEWNGRVAGRASGIRERPAVSMHGTMDFGQYRKSIIAIKRRISRGETYQVNFTFDVGVSSASDPFSLYCHLRSQQPARYCAYVNTGSMIFASFSPELFFSAGPGVIRVQPMKGTAPRGRYIEEDRALATQLAADPKNRSENIMIVDMLRNDLGKICTAGSVITEKLLQVQSLPTVHQMTSTIRGRPARGTMFSDIVKALFPCGSVTGAPKIRTMQIIRSLETGNRGVYCGALGFISPAGTMQFSVPIRTLQRPVRARRWRYRVGSGIVWDSSAAAEWQECHDKCAFLTRNEPEFDLLESMLWRDGFKYLRPHLQRMKSSAAFFAIPWDTIAVRRVLDEAAARLHGKGPAKVRVLLDKKGHFRWDATSLEAVRRSVPALAIISRKSVDSNNIFLYHKTTRRPWYDGAMGQISRGRWYDVIFTNTQGEVTEGARTNVFIERDGKLMTPPVRCGLLPGVLRRTLLARGTCVEKIISPDELMDADAVFLGNSVRGMMKVRVRT